MNIITVLGNYTQQWCYKIVSDTGNLIYTRGWYGSREAARNEGLQTLLKCIVEEVN